MVVLGGTVKEEESPPITSAPGVLVDCNNQACIAGCCDHSQACIGCCDHAPNTCTTESILFYLIPGAVLNPSVGNNNKTSRPSTTIQRFGQNGKMVAAAQQQQVKKEKKA